MKSFLVVVWVFLVLNIIGSFVEGYFTQRDSPSYHSSSFHGISDNVFLEYIPINDTVVYYEVSDYSLITSSVGIRITGDYNYQQFSMLPVSADDEFVLCFTGTDSSNSQNFMSCSWFQFVNGAHVSLGKGRTNINTVLAPSLTTGSISVFGDVVYFHSADPNNVGVSYIWTINKNDNTGSFFPTVPSTNSNQYGPVALLGSYLVAAKRNTLQDNSYEINVQVFDTNGVQQTQYPTINAPGSPQLFAFTILGQTLVTISAPSTEATSITMEKYSLITGEFTSTTTSPMVNGWYFLSTSHNSVMQILLRSGDITMIELNEESDLDNPVGSTTFAFNSFGTKHSIVSQGSYSLSGFMPIVSYSGSKVGYVFHGGAGFEQILVEKATDIDFPSGDKVTSFVVPVWASGISKFYETNGLSGTISISDYSPQNAFVTPPTMSGTTLHFEANPSYRGPVTITTVFNSVSSIANLNFIASTYSSIFLSTEKYVYCLDLYSSNTYYAPFVTNSPPDYIQLQLPGSTRGTKYLDSDCKYQDIQTPNYKFVNHK